jgi:hypothetical protein
MRAVAAAQPQPQPANQPEGKKTVDAFTGTWTGDVTISMSGRAPEKVKATATCRKVAMGAAVSCDVKGQGKAAMPIDQTCLIGANVEGAAGVHLMCASATGEIHDHVGGWSGGQLQFQPYRFQMSGGEASETVSFTWPASGKILVQARTAMPNGRIGTVEYNLKRT